MDLSKTDTFTKLMFALIAISFIIINPFSKTFYQKKKIIIIINANVRN